MSQLPSATADQSQKDAGTNQESGRPAQDDRPKPESPARPGGWRNRKAPPYPSFDAGDDEDQEEEQQDEQQEGQEGQEENANPEIDRPNIGGRGELAVMQSVQVVGEVVEDGMLRRDCSPTENDTDRLKAELPAAAQVVDDAWVADKDALDQARKMVAQERGVAEEDVTPRQAVGKVERNPYQLSQRQARAMDLMLRGFSMTEVGRRLGVTRRTVHRWRYNHPTFITVYSRLTQELEEQTARRAEGLVYRAMDIVGQVLGKPEESALQTSVALRVLGQLKVSKLMFDRPGEDLFLPTVDQVIRRTRIAEGDDPDAPIWEGARKDALSRMEKENETEEVEEVQEGQELTEVPEAA